MSSLYLNGNSWYIRSRGKGYSTGCGKAFTKSQVKAKIVSMPDGTTLKSMFFDIEPNEHKNEKVTVDYAIEKYSLTKNGLGQEGQVIDENQDRNFRRVSKSAFDRILREFKGRFLHEISDSDILSWMRKLRGEGLKPESVKRYVNTFSPVFSFGRSKYRGWCKDNPIIDDGAVRKEFKTNKGVWNYQGREVDITEAEAFALLEASKQLSKPFHLLMLLNFNVGARRREMLTLKRRDVDLDAKRFTVLTVNAKVKEQRPVFFGFASEICMLMAEVCDGKGPEDYIFSSSKAERFSETWVRASFEKAKVMAKLPKKWTFRDFRHIAGQRMNANGIPLNMIASALGTSVKLLQKTYLRQSRSFVEEIFMKKLAA